MTTTDQPLTLASIAAEKLKLDEQRREIVRRFEVLNAAEVRLQQGEAIGDGE